MNINPIEILIVEDEDLVALDIENNLTQAGFKIASSVPSGMEAIRSIEKRVPELVLMDIKLDGEPDGITTAKFIRSRFDVPAIYLTAYSDDEILERAQKTEPYGYITKPFKAKDVISTIKMAIYKHQQEFQRSKMEKPRNTLTICPWCKKSKKGQEFGEEGWEQIEVLIQNNIIDHIKHCICPDCLLKLQYQLTRILGEQPDSRLN